MPRDDEEFEKRLTDYSYMMYRLGFGGTADCLEKLKEEAARDRESILELAVTSADRQGKDDTSPELA